MNFNFETVGYKNSSAQELLSKKYATFFTFHGQKWCQGSKFWRHFCPWNVTNVAYLFDKSSCALEFLLPIVWKLKFINLERSSLRFLDFQAITLRMLIEINISRFEKFSFISMGMQNYSGIITVYHFGANIFI